MASGVMVLLAATFFGVANARILSASEGRIYDNVASMPHHRVGIVLGCAPKIQGRHNYFFLGRINAAYELYRSGKVDRLLVSGDNGTRSYDEPTAMAEALIAKGVPAEHITRDFAGFRTLDTMVRAKQVFGVSDATVITDDFHLARSLYYARDAGIEADGYPSRAIENNMTASVKFREVLARGLAVLDADVLNVQPKFLGRREEIL